MDAARVVGVGSVVGVAFDAGAACVECVTGSAGIVGVATGIWLNRGETMLAPVFECFVFSSDEWALEGGGG